MSNVLSPASKAPMCRFASCSCAASTSSRRTAWFCRAQLQAKMDLWRAEAQNTTGGRSLTFSEPRGSKGPKRVTRSHPCPICKKPDWCAVTTDGRLCRCQRVEQGAFKTGTDRRGESYYLHRLGDGPWPALKLIGNSAGALAI